MLRAGTTSAALGISEHQMRLLKTRNLPQSFRSLLFPSSLPQIKGKENPIVCLESQNRIMASLRLQKTSKVLEPNLWPKRWIHIRVQVFNFTQKGHEAGNHKNITKPLNFCAKHSWHTAPAAPCFQLTPIPTGVTWAHFCSAASFSQGKAQHGNSAEGGKRELILPSPHTNRQPPLTSLSTSISAGLHHGGTKRFSSADYK